MTLLELESYLAFLRKANYAGDNTKVFIGIDRYDESGDSELVYMVPEPPERDGTNILIPAH